VLELITSKPNAKYLLVVGDAIIQIDASGEEVVHLYNGVDLTSF
jgi:SulP family sulfate permease